MATTGSNQRVLQRDKPKQHIVESLIQSWWKDNPEVEKAVISIKADKMTRSQKQNKLYWMWIDTIGQELGYHRDEMHILLKDKLLGYDEIETRKGEVVKALKSTAKLSVDEMKDYLEAVDFFATHYGIKLMHPEDLYLDSIGYKRDV